MLTHGNILAAVGVGACHGVRQRAPMSFGLGVTLPHARAAARSHAPMRSAAVARNRTATRAMQPVLMCGAQPELGG